MQLEERIPNMHSLQPPAKNPDLESLSPKAWAPTANCHTTMGSNVGIAGVGCLFAPRPPLSGTLIHMHSDGAEVLFLVVFLWGLWSASRLGALYSDGGRFSVEFLFWSGNDRPFCEFACKEPV